MQKSSNLFRVETFEEEIAKSMQSRLVSNRAKKQYSFDKIAKAADFINTAAEILDDTGFAAEAEILVQVLEKLAAGPDKKKALATKGIGELTEAEMKFFDSLSPSMKKILEQHVRKSPDGRGYDMGEFVDELKLLYQIRKREPMIEMDSLTGQNPLSSAPKVDWGQFKVDDNSSSKKAHR